MKQKITLSHIPIQLTLVTLYLLSTLLASACGKQSVEPTPDTLDTVQSEIETETTPVVSLPDPTTSPMSNVEKLQALYHDYKETGGEVAVVTDQSAILDGGYNQAVFEGAVTYAQAAGVSYSFYSSQYDTEEAYEKTITDAIDYGAKLVICAGSHFARPVGALQDTYPDVHYLLLDAVPVDANDKELPISKQVHCITFHEEEAGYLAGYMTVLEGYTRLGFIGGEAIPAVTRYGSGYLQGINDAAIKLDITDEVEVNYWYSGTFYPDQDIADRAEAWLTDGTQVIFSCGGSIYESMLDSINAHDAYLIGADVNQGKLSDRFLTSAMKGLKNAVIIALDDYFAYGDEWSDEAGSVMNYGAQVKCIELPTDSDSWRFQTVTIDDYNELFQQMKTGNISVSDTLEDSSALSITVTDFNRK